MNGEYEGFARRREQYVDAILDSPARKKLVVAGPGTGKTHLFRRMLEGKSPCLTLTFVNSLVEDLSRELSGLSEVKTLHGFALAQLSRYISGEARVFPKLCEILKEDATVILGEEINFESLLHNKAPLEGPLEFYRERRRWYEYYGFPDLVYATVLRFEQRPDRIPSYAQVVVDEFQDFNVLEVSLIEQLASKSPILVVGDDDQALYESLKCASPEHIRIRHADRSYGYVPFELPYCSRSSQVIVETVKDLLAQAGDNGLLGGRVAKSFEYFPSCERDAISAANPHILLRSVFESQMPWFIEEQVRTLTQSVREDYTVLIMSPYGKHCQRLCEALNAKGFRNVQFARRSDTTSPSVLDGLMLLLEDKDSNLGWRIVTWFLLERHAFEALLQTTAGNSVRMRDHVNAALKADVNRVLKGLRAVRDRRKLIDGDLAALLTNMGVRVYEPATESLRDYLLTCDRGTAGPAIRNVPIRVSTFQSAKGLAADYVFITHVDDQFCIGDRAGRMSDRDMCSFLVALTRASRRVYLLSTDSASTPTFVSWIDPSRVCQL